MKHIRIFSSQKCQKCSELKLLLDGIKVAYIVIDAMRYDDPEINDLCEKYDVGDLPHVQILDSSDVVKEWVGDAVVPVDVIGLINREKEQFEPQA